MENDEQRTYSIGDLADVAGVSTRTVRYYVSEGLLPPPVGSGPGSRYTEAHRLQLIEIARLKEQFLPLKEIRRHLIGHGAPPPHASVAESRPAPAPVHDAERSTPYLDRSGAGARFESAANEISDLPFTSDQIGAQVRQMSQRMASEPEARQQYRHAARSMPPPPAEGQTWRRVGITDEAELLITEDQYHRHQDRIDWLVQWAKRVLEP